MRFQSSHRWTLCVTPKSPKAWLKTRIFTFGVAFHFFAAGNRTHFKFGMWVEYSKSQPTDDKLSLKWAWSRHMTYFKFLVSLRYLWKLKRLKLETSNLVCMFIIASLSLQIDKLSLKGAWSLSRDLFIFWKICNNISKTVPDGFTVSIKFGWKLVCTLSNGYVADHHHHHHNRTCKAPPTGAQRRRTIQCRWPWVTPNHLKPPQFLHFALPYASS